MDKNNQIIIAGILIIILAAGSAYFFYTQSNAESEKISSLKKEIAVIVEERIELISKAEEVKKMKKELTNNLQDYSVEIQNNEAEITDIKKVREDMLVQLKEKKEALSKVAQAADDVRLTESALKNDLSKVKASHEEVLRNQESMQKEKSLLEDKIKAYLQASRGVELRKIVVKMASPVNGKIIDVNSEYNFAVIDLGSADAIKNGDVLGIYRDEALVAKAVIENVYEDMSSIIVFDEWRNIEIFYGDNIKLLQV